MIIATAAAAMPCHLVLACERHRYDCSSFLYSMHFGNQACDQVSDLLTCHIGYNSADVGAKSQTGDFEVGQLIQTFSNKPLSQW